jgi:hypothetical protein
MIKLPVIRGVIRRRILVNFRVDPEVMRRQLPQGLEPKLHDGAAVAGICLIRLEQIRPKRLPALFGIASENAAHRVAVEWQDVDGVHEGVYIPRRDTNSLLNRLAGGRLFPGQQHKAVFKVTESNDRIQLSMASSDGDVIVEVSGTVGTSLAATSGFRSMADASAFFEAGALGYSATSDSNRLDGILLQTENWAVEPLNIDHVRSSYFENRSMFPEGSVRFDCALLMRNLAHEWHAAADMVLDGSRNRC